ncbi:protein of unknown function [Acidithiobacillus ferrivorans]|uniref:Transposase n=1 Tax=Acidithiobacillus ferrivorans TaxID=160808 RepID=A0ABY1MNH4_9PROT|nr:protein of unknown function [Acidithiobacillus ferrivorans]
MRDARSLVRIILIMLNDLWTKLKNQLFKKAYPSHRKLTNAATA